MPRKKAPAEWVKIDDLKPWDDNPRNNQIAIDKVAQSIKRFGFGAPIIARKEDGEVIAGHTRLEAAKLLSLKEVPVRYLDLDPVDAHLLALADNKLGEVAEWDDLKLKDIFEKESFAVDDLFIAGFDAGALDDIIDSELPDLDLLPKNWVDDEINKGVLVETFGAPPFSVINTNQGYWKTRKNYWLDFGIESYLGRDNLKVATVSSTSLDRITGIQHKGGGSVFDPALCEVMYNWFNVKEGTILDPFAGGSVRGLIASALGYKYFGHELRSVQVKSNREQYHTVGLSNNWKIEPIWIEGDSNKTIEKYHEPIDMVFSCPPYSFLEVYSDSKEDISNMEYDKFLIIYKEIIAKSCARLKDDRFAVFVVGELRNKNGSYANFVGDTINAFIECGMSYYNEIIYQTPIGSLAIRAPKAFKTSRKIGKTHQNILVFYKGDTSNCSKYWRDIDIKIQDIETEIDNNQKEDN